MYMTPFLCFAFPREHDLNPDGMSSMEIVEQQNISSSPTKYGKQIKSKAALNNPGVLTSSDKDGRGKRGRPTGTSTNKRKTGVIKPRGKPVRRGSKSAKIHENESDANASSGENAVKEETENEIGNPEIRGIAGQGSQECKDKAMVEYDCDSSQRGKALETLGFGEDGRTQEEWFNRAHGIEGGGNSGMRESKKLEVMGDPVQSMLLDMIPSLGMKKVDRVDPVVETKEVHRVDPVVEGRKPPEDNNMDIAEPVKKKRVSYKDVAGELLKDYW